MRKGITFVAAMLMTVGAAATAQQPAPPAQAQVQAEPKVLKLGDPAPTLKIAKWIKGEPVTEFQTGQVYVVEFWATWCGPCIKGMPHLTELQKQYKDKGVTIVSVTSEDKNNPLEKVEKMVADKADVMGYTVAWDDGRLTNEAYMRAAQQNFIPCAFVVNQEGRIAWIGHPGEMDEVLAKVVAKEWSLEDAKQLESASKAKEAQANEQSAKARMLLSKMEAAYEAEKFGEVVATADELFNLDPARFWQYAGFKLQVMLVNMKDNAAAYSWARSVAEGVAKDNPMALNAMAWVVVDPKNEIDNRDTEFALKAAQRAVDLTKGQDGMIIDTLAHAYYYKGDLAKAIEWETKALENVDQDEYKDEFTKILAAWKEELKAKSGG